MAPNSDLSPRLWTRDELSLQRRDSIDRFVRWWRQAGNSSYLRHVEVARRSVEDVFLRTNDLASLSSVTIPRKEREAREVVRYLAGPPLSSDDVQLLIRAQEAAGEAASPSLEELIRSVLDPKRFPWCFDEAGVRRPTAQEREVALSWTAGLIAAQKAATARRIGASGRQEKAVEASLLDPAVGFTKVPARDIHHVRDFLQPGEFCRQSSVAGTRADFSIGLGRGMLVIECKVSNSEVNSYKRLNHEVGNKAGRWKAAFGASVIPAAILDGVFKLDNLEKAQTASIALFWEYDLQPLVDFVRAAR